MRTASDAASGSWPRPFAVGVLAFAAPVDGADLAAELLVSRVGPDALITRGPVDPDWLHALADRHPLVIRSNEDHPCGW